MKAIIRIIVVLFIVLVSAPKLKAQAAQPPLPQFDLQILGKDKVRISWVNPFGEDLIQINVQRSYDSVRGYKTVFSSPSPELPQNGFVETYYPGVRVYYRIFYMLSSNAYFFAKAKSTVPSLLADSVAAKLAAGNDTVTIKSTDSIVTRLPYSQFLKFKDSIYTKTKDSLFSLSSDTILLRPYVYDGAWHASVYLFTDRSGVINLKLPNAGEKSYSLRVYEADNRTQLFSIKHITEPNLMIDKANFMHGGWFMFELYEDNKLKERNKVFVQKEF